MLERPLFSLHNARYTTIILTFVCYNNVRSISRHRLRHLAPGSDENWTLIAVAVVHALQRASGLNCELRGLLGGALPLFLERHGANDDHGETTSVRPVKSPGPDAGSERFTWTRSEATTHKQESKTEDFAFVSLLHHCSSTSNVTCPHIERSDSPPHEQAT